MKILVVDDNHDLREQITTYLKSKYHDILDAPNGKRAMQVAEKENGSIDLVVTDYHMPVMDGITFIKEFKRTWSSTPVIVMTASVLEEIDWASLGALCVIRKPFDLSSFVTMIESICNKSSHTRKLPWTPVQRYKRGLAQDYYEYSADISRIELSLHLNRDKDTWCFSCASLGIAKIELGTDSLQQAQEAAEAIFIDTLSDKVMIFQEILNNLK